MTPIKEAPTSWKGMLKHLGPGLIVTACIVGSGELIVTPKLGAEAGFTLLWFIIIGCLLKVFVQVELGRYSIAKGQTTLEAMNSMPGPRFVASWLVWLWLLMYLALVFQVAGMVGAIAQIMGLAGSTLPEWVWGLGVVGATIGLLVGGKYKLVEVTATLMVAFFTACTIVAVGALKWSPYAITGDQIMSGLTFSLPEGGFTVAFAAFGIIGVGASELIYYPYWCLEKGYARHAGERDSSAEWFARAKGWIRVMRVDAFVSLVVYTGATVAFYLLGAAVLHGKGLKVEDLDMIETLSHMYRETFGAWGLTLFLIGGCVVLFSTVFGATASNARLFADALSVFKVREYPTQASREKMIRLGCIILPIASLVVYLALGKPVSLVFVGAIAQGVMLPFLGIAALYFRFKRTDRALTPGTVWTVCLLLSAAAMMAVGCYQVIAELSKKLS